MDTLTIKTGDETIKRTSGGLPGMRRMDHVGFTVPDLEQATAFLVDVLGCEYMYTLGPMRSEGNWMREQLAVDPRAVINEIRFFRAGDGSMMEVFDYAAPGRAETIPRNSDIGGHHLAFYVDDLDVAVAYLRAHDVTVLGEVVASTGASTGQRWIYFLTPWGMQMELVSYPGGKAFDRVE
jgi:glyoxylase I family protein